MRLFLLFLVLTVQWTSANLDHLDVEVEYQCIQHCPLQNRTDAGHYDYACDYGCNINQCNKGCKLWRRALNSSCQQVCVSVWRHPQTPSHDLIFRTVRWTASPPKRSTA
jgi:hypothetical protein